MPTVTMLRVLSEASALAHMLDSATPQLIEHAKTRLNQQKQYGVPHLVMGSFRHLAMPRLSSMHHPTSTWVEAFPVFLPVQVVQGPAHMPVLVNRYFPTAIHDVLLQG
jgi:hypothetical protein